MPDTSISLDDAVRLTRTGDIWLFRGRTLADRFIRVTTNAPVNHVGMAVVLEDLPPLMWHAELGKSLPDLWSGKVQRGVQLHDLRDATLTWAHRYGQDAWLRQLDAWVTSDMEDAVLETIARLDGLAFPTRRGLFAGWLRGRFPVGAAGEREQQRETAYCAEVLAITYQEMGLLTKERLPSYYDPGRFWSGDDLELLRGARLSTEIAVEIPELRP